MYDEQRIARSWIIYGMVFGLLADVMYSVAAFAPVPEAVGQLIGFAFGPLLTLSFLGFYHFFRLHRMTVPLQIATLYGIIAGTVVNLMVVVQEAIHVTVPVEARDQLGLAYDGLNMVQLGLDVSWDIYLSLATVLLGMLMLRHPRFGPVWGAATVVIGAGLLALNLAAFPIPPVDAALFDLGPVTGAVYMLVAIRILTSMKWVDEQLKGGAEERPEPLPEPVGSAL